MKTDFSTVIFSINMNPMVGFEIESFMEIVN